MRRIEAAVKYLARTDTTRWSDISLGAQPGWNITEIEAHIDHALDSLWTRFGATLQSVTKVRAQLGGVRRSFGVQLGGAVRGLQSVDATSFTWTDVDAVWRCRQYRCDSTE